MGWLCQSCLALLLALSLVGCAQAQVSTNQHSTEPLPDPPREFRGVWVASVANINWPSQPGLTTAKQKKELLAILDKAAELNLNAVLLQVRPACEVLFQSDLEPWSEYLTGATGRAPDPFYDPLEFAVKEAHARGLELHAWFNPFRARHFSAKSPLSANPVIKEHPGWICRYGNYLWLDPGEPAAREHCLKVILDVVRRYDVDGIHFDDYFYPYPQKAADGKLLPFPDSATWRTYSHGLSLSDWRRKNVNDFIQQLEQAIHAEKSWMRFGISPFGIWRPGHPEQIQGLDAFNAISADARKWFREGWVDYLAPQLYWSIDSPGQSFPVLLEWWGDQNVRHRSLYAGLNTGKVGSTWSQNEILNQIRMTRQFGINGHVHYNIGTLQHNESLSAELKQRFYTRRALTPSAPWLDSNPPPPPNVELRANRSSKLTWQPGEGKPVVHWVLQWKADGAWQTLILPGSLREHSFSGPPPQRIALRAVDQYGNLSAPTWVAPKPASTRRP